MDERESAPLGVGAEHQVNDHFDRGGMDLGTPATVALPCTNGIIILPVPHLVRLEADGGYTHVHQVHGKRHLVSRRLGDLYRLLPAGRFFRCHHGHAINLTFVAELIRTGGHRVRLTTGENVVVARRRWKELLSAFGHQGLSHTTVRITDPR